MNVRGWLIIAMTGWMLAAGQSQAGPLPIKEAKASSTLPDSMGVSFDAGKAVDGKLGTPWIEGEASAGLGDWLEVQFGEEVTLSRIELYVGHWDGREFFQRHNRPKSVLAKFSNGSSVKIDLLDKMERQTFKLPQPVKTRSVRLVLKEVFAGSTFNDTCISEVQFFDESRETALDKARAKAVSALPGDADRTYTAPNLVDGLLDSSWCEGRKDGGVGEIITLTLPGPTVLGTLRIYNGVAASDETYKNNGRVKRVKLEPAGGKPIEATVEDTFGAWQEVALGGMKTTSLKMTLLEVVPGARFNDTCMSEIQLVAP